MPGWQPTSEADLDQVLIDLLAADADELADYQDRVGNEAFLATARKRLSLARHARLMDYHIHQGNQAATWLALRVTLKADLPAAPADEFAVWTGEKWTDPRAVATIKDIALKAGVSSATVSHVINQTRFVSEKLKETVHNAIRELNYHPNAIARSLVLKQTQTIGVIITDILNPFYTAVVRGIEDATSRKGYNVILCNTDEDPGKEDLYIKLLLGKRVDGIAISTAFKERVHPLIDKLCQVSVDTIVRKMEGIRTDAVFGDNVGGAYKAIDHLVGLGHRKIGVISGPHGLSSGRERLEGCLKAFSANGLKPAPEWT